MRISEAYRKEQERLHALTEYGTASIHYAPLVNQIITKLGVTELLDYGCGKSANLAKHLKVGHKMTIQCYDPGVPEFSGEPVPMQMVACVDVLEHIEPDCLDEVLDHLKELTQGVGFFTIATGPAKKTLSDGRNAHLIQEPAEWWLPKIFQRFDLQTFQQVGDHGFYLIVYSKPKPLIEVPQ